MSFIASAVVTALLSSTANLSLWDGKYSCELDLGTTTSGVSAWANYDLLINGDSCNLQVTGFQVDEKINCNADGNENELNVMFDSYSNGSVENIYGVQVYEKGEELFSLEYKGDKILTSWKGINSDQPIDKNKNCFSK
ncbi:DUF5991 domain-containing protein [Photobacterium japonica]|uniref:DUF5991 domain-containing protein n=1 Tax=Photobacterium japonica TaxID=2910235 RepID=UPI003D0D84E8